MAVELQRGLSQLRNTRPCRPDPDDGRRPPSVWPGKGAEATKIQGEIEDEKAARAARKRPAVGDQLWRSWRDQQGVEDGESRLAS